MKKVTVSAKEYAIAGSINSVQKGSSEIVISPEPYIKSGYRKAAMIVEKTQLTEEQIKRLCGTGITNRNIYELNSTQTPYYITLVDDKNEEEAMKSLLYHVDRLKFNQIILKSRYTVLWTIKQDTTHIYYTYSLGELKLIAAANGHLGNGFYFQAGYYKDGQAIINGDYAIISVNESNAGEEKIVGNINQIKNYLTSAQQSDVTAVSAKNFILVKLETDSSTGYNYTLCAGRLSGGISLSQIQSWLNANTSSSSNTSPNINGGSIGGLLPGSNYSSAYNTISRYGGLVNPISSITALEYINNFGECSLVFKAGNDERGIKKVEEDNKEEVDVPEKEDKKIIISEEQLIITTKLPESEMQKLSNTMQLSNKHYIYIPINESNYTHEDFFDYLDNILNIDFESEEYIWKNNSPPIFKLKHKANEDSLIESNWDNLPNKWKLLPMTSIAVNKEWYNTLSDYITEGSDLEFVQSQITLEMCLKDKNAKAIGLKDFFMKEPKERVLFKLLFFNVFEKENETFETSISEIKSFEAFLSEISEVLNFAEKKILECVLKFEQKRKALNLYELKLFEAYTRGHDFIQEDYTTVRPQEQDANGNKLMNFDDNYFTYKYSGRDFDIIKGNTDKSLLFSLPHSQGVYCAMTHEKDLLLETDVTLGEVYGCQKYFVEALKYYNNDKKQYDYKDTFKITNYVDALDATKYTEDDIEVVTAKIDLAQCEYYNPTKATFENKWCDCCYNGKIYDKECIYQKLGYCPYRFQTEKHPRKIRTLVAEKSNRFNLIQELSKIFEIYPQFYVEFDRNGKILLDEKGRMKKHVFFITEKGGVQPYGFRYEKNLSSISRQVDSTSLTTKLYVENVDSELSKTGLCSIETAEDNIGKNSYIMDFSYYTQKGLLDTEQVVRDLYGINKNDLAFLPTIGYYNTKYDDLTNLIINMTGEGMKKLKAANIVNIEGITASLEERQKIAQRMYQFKIRWAEKSSEEDYTISDTYQNYLIKWKEQAIIMWGLVEDLFFNEDYFNLIIKKDKENYNFYNVKYNNNYENDLSELGIIQNLITLYSSKYCRGELFWRLMIEGFEDEEEYVPPFESWEDFKNAIIEPHIYPTNGKEGQYKEMYDQVKHWKLQRSEWLNKINNVSDTFYKKYEPYIKEGTWTDSNYLTDNEYYWAAVSVLEDSSKPKITYNISVIDLSAIDEDYTFELADTTFIEDIDFFGINNKTGLPNRQKVLISAITYDLDIPMQNSIEVQNYTTAFEDLFQSITATVQSLTFNENTYKRSANFNATKYISKESLQGTLFEGDLTLIETKDDNITIDESGTMGKGIDNTSSQYKLTGEGLYFSKDGGKTWDVGVGPNGINADYIKFGQLDASKIQIVDGNYIYFLWDKDGLNAYRNPANSTNGLVDFTRFNKYGLSLIENSNVRLRAGYEFKTNEDTNLTGDYRTELDLTDQNVGFYLYNDSGQAIFKTETASTYKGVQGDYSARLSLAGEMFVTNRVLDGDNSGQVISGKPEYIYTCGYNIVEQKVASLSENKSLSEIATQYYNGEIYSILSANLDVNGNIIPDKNLEYNNITPQEEIEITHSITVYKVDNISTGASVPYYFNQNKDTITKVVNEGDIVESVLSYAIYNIKILDSELVNGTIPKELLNTKFENAQPVGHYNVAIYKKKEGNNIIIYGGNTTTAMIMNEKEPVAFFKTGEDVSPEKLIIWDIRNLAPGQSIDVKKTYSLYRVNNYGGSPYQFWAAKELTGNQIIVNSSKVKTDEVGIFINNKTSVHGGSEIVRNFNNPVSTINIPDVDENSEINLLEDSPPTTTTSIGINVDSNDFVLIGDSITNGLSISSDFKDRAVGVGSASVDDSRISHEPFYNNDSIKRAKNLAFFFGVNDINMNYKVDKYFEMYQNTISTILEKNGLSFTNVKIYILSTISLNRDDFPESKVSDFQTTYLKAFAEQHNYPFVNIYEKTKGIPLADGVHPTAQGYQELYNIIKDAFGNTTINTTIFNETKPTTQEDASIIASRETVLAGAERIFMTALSGENEGDVIYHNILSVLKNGCLYIGGTISDFYGRKLEMSSFGLMPDEVRINDAKIVMSNDGKVWMDFRNLFAIDENGNLTDTSLWDLLEQLSNGISSIGGKPSDSSGNVSGMKPGYYLIDPIAD